MLPDILPVYLLPKNPHWPPVTFSTSWTQQNLFKLNVYFKYIYGLITTLELYGTPRLHLLVFCLKQLLHPSGWIYTIIGPQKTDELPLTWLSNSALFSLALTLFSLGSISMWCSYLLYVVKIQWVSYLDLESGALLFSYRERLFALKNSESSNLLMLLLSLNRMNCKKYNHIHLIRNYSWCWWHTSADFAVQIGCFGTDGCKLPLSFWRKTPYLPSLPMQLIRVLNLQP